MPPRRRLRRRAGAALVAGGLVLVAFAGTRYVEGAVRADSVRERWEAAQARAAVEAVRRGDATAPTGALEPGAPVARLLIPRLSLDEIIVEGTGDGELNTGPGHLPGSAIPGQPGNAIVSAHRDRHFFPLAELKVGDTVVTEVGTAATRWTVVSRRIVKAGAPALFRKADATLTLTTCWPIRYFGPAPDRLVITARPLAAAPDRRS